MLNSTFRRKDRNQIMTSIENTQDTMLMQIQTKGMNNPDGYFAITMQNEYYRVRIHYMEPNYPKHKAEGDFKPSDIVFTIIPLKSSALPIDFVLSDKKDHTIVVDSSGQDKVLKEDEIEDYIQDLVKSLNAAKSAIRQIKETIKTYFGDDII